MVLVNFWLLLSPAARVALSGVAQVSPQGITLGPQPPPAVVTSMTFPLLNVLGADTIKLVRNFPERHSDLFPPEIWNCYARGEGYSDFVAMREELQDLHAAHPDDISVAGCWNVATGEPIGGVGSPWFATPPELAGLMPGIQQPGVPGQPPLAPVPPVFNVLHDIVLMAGQAARKFV